LQKFIAMAARPDCGLVVQKTMSRDSPRRKMHDVNSRHDRDGSAIIAPLKLVSGNSSHSA
jgi:hypothetical protein